MKTIERRLIKKSELRALAPDKDNEKNSEKETKKDTTTVEGYGLLFNTLSKNLGGFKEKIDPKALNNVDLSKVYMLFNHNYDKPLASVEAGNLSLTIDDKGLKFIANLDDSVSYVSDVINQVNNGNIKNCSFSFDVDTTDDQAEVFSEDNGETVRTINKIKDLFDVSLVTIPAYDETTVKVDKRSYNDYKNNEMEIPEMQTVKTKQPKETRDFVNYIKSRGENRDGLTTTNMGSLVPDSIMSEIKDFNAGKLDLKSRVDVRPVSTGSGALPLVDSTAVAHSKEELAENPDLDNDVKTVDFKTTTYAGQIALSSELIQDSSDVNIKNAIIKDMAVIAQNTYNDKIVNVANSQPTTTIASLDDLMSAILTLDPRFKKEILMDTNMYAFVRTLKDNTGNYIIKDDSILGLPITVTNLVQGAVIGDLNSAIVLFDRENTSINWQKFDSFSEGLALIMRLDVKNVSDKAIKHVAMASK
ncbi:phage major capsid protein [Apilactobacillus timberlakei]|uniref:phage major capsid protein n=1 Tax=Apilactobacillus timberlakei TaxID=2008380 RepID=UPI001125D9DE|nr:phage major capsid protein [Apilactobacillus timberlakei]TPR12143.1 phage major capsid protein [Apilactobacillus timberlakei]